MAVLTEEKYSSRFLATISEKTHDGSEKLICRLPEGTRRFSRGSRIWLYGPSFGEILIADYIDKVKSGEIPAMLEEGEDIAGGVAGAIPEVAPPLAQLDRNPEQESQALKVIQAQIVSFQSRYPYDEPIHIALQKARDALFAAELVYVPYLDKRYEVV